MKGRKIVATIDVHLVQISDENTTQAAESIVSDWCDQVQVESLYVMDENDDWDAKFDVSDCVVVRVLDSEEVDDVDDIDTSDVIDLTVDNG